MTPRLPALTAKKLIRILKHHGFESERQSGSHLILCHPDGRRVTVPVHSQRDLGRGLLRSIMKDAGLTLKDLK